MIARFVTLGAALLIAGCSAEKKAEPAKLAVTDAVVRLPAVEGRPAAAYFTLKGGTSDDRLVSIASDKAASIELHESRMVNGMMTMQPLTGVDVLKGTTVTFKPGGNHAMLFGLDPAVKPGGTLALRFSFQSGAALDVNAATVAPGDEMPMAHEEH